MAVSTKTADEQVDLPPKARQLRELGRTVLGEAWQYRLAQMNKVGLKTVSRWATGHRQTPDAVINQLEWLRKELEDYHLEKILQSIRDIAEHGIDLHVLSAHLTDIALEFRPVKSVPADKRYRNKRKPKPAPPDADSDPSIPN